jgi:hypothetical protein
METGGIQAKADAKSKVRKSDQSGSRMHFQRLGLTGRSLA